MTPQRWEDVKKIFDLAVGSDSLEREFLLSRACEGDSELRVEVDRLLSHHSQASYFLETPLMRLPDLLSTPPAPAFAEGEVVSGRFKIIRHIGSGGMGEVYQAEDLALSGEIAIKTIRPETSADVRTLARFKREIQLGRSVTHPNVCRVYDIASYQSPSAGTTIYLTMEMVYGETLSTLLRRQGALSFPDAVPLIRQMAAALDAAHRAGVIHRDFKPSNVMIACGPGEERRAVVTDFGLARAMDAPSAADRVSVSKAIIGTPAYMAPEQIEGQPITAATDVYAFGLVVYEMATGQQPFPGASSFAGALKRLTTPPARLRTIRPDLAAPWEDLILRCLELDPARRFQSATELLAALAEIDSKPSVARHYARSRAATPLRRAAVAAVLLLLAIVVGWTTYSKNPSAPPLLDGSARFTPLTTAPGQELFPSFSANEKEVIYAGQSGGNWDLYRLKIGEKDAANLTAGSGVDNTQPAISPDGRVIAFRSERGGGGIFLMPASGGAVTRLSSMGYFPAWSRDGKRIASSTANFTRPARGDIGRSRLLIIDVKTGNQQLLNLNDDPLQPSWSPRGNRIAYWRLRNGRRDICTVAAEGGSQTCITNDNHVNWNPAWSPDGRYLYFASDRGGSMNLWRVPVNDESGLAQGEPTPLTTPSAYSGYFALSRPGNVMAYAQLAQTSHIQQVAFDPELRIVSGKPAPLTQGLRVTCCPAPAPDGEWVAFGTGAGHEGIYKVRADGTQESQLTFSEHRNRQPRWSPKGGLVAFTSNRGGTSEIWVIRPDGTGLRQLTAEGGLPIVFSGWSPDGKRLFYDVKGDTPRIMDVDKPWGQQTPLILPHPEGGNSAFIATSWSQDGERIAGDVYHADGSHAGLSVYSVKSQTYQPLTQSGSFGVWLKDNRSLLFEREGRIWLFDTASRSQRELLAVPGGEVEDDFSISPDQRTIYFRLTHTEADLWLVTRQKPAQ